MPITLTPEQKATVIADAKAAGFESPNHYLAERLSSFHEEALYFAAHREEVDRLIEAGLAEADRGDLMSGEEAKADIERLKREIMFRAPAA